jgi:hypothetical protein
MVMAPYPKDQVFRVRCAFAALSMSLAIVDTPVFEDNFNTHYENEGCEQSMQFKIPDLNVNEKNATRREDCVLRKCLIVQEGG